MKVGVVLADGLSFGESGWGLVKSGRGLLGGQSLKSAKA